MTMSRFLTKNIFLPLSHARRSRSTEMRPVFRAYQAGLRFRREAEHYNEDRKRAWILQQLRLTVPARGA